LIFSPDGKRLAAWVSFGGMRKPPPELRIWDAITGKELLAIDGSPYGPFGMLFNLAFSSDSKRLAAVGIYGESVYHEADKVRWEVKEWDTATGKQLLTWKALSNMDLNVAFSPNSQRILLMELTGPAAENSCQFRLVDYATDKELRTWRVRGADQGTGQVGYGQMVFSPNGRHVAVMAPTGTILAPADEVKVWDAITGQERRSLKLGSVGPFVFSPDGKRLVTSRGYEFPSWQAEHAEVKVWDVDTGVDLLTLKWPHLLTNITFSSDGNRLVLVGNVFSTKEPFFTPVVQVVDATPLPEKPPADRGPR
jgi:WD40 repeat protein